MKYQEIILSDKDDDTFFGTSEVGDYLSCLPSFTPETRYKVSISGSSSWFGREYYFKGSKLHREDGPARIILSPDKNITYCLEGDILSKEKWKERLFSINLENLLQE